MTKFERNTTHDQTVYTAENNSKRFYAPVSLWFDNKILPHICYLCQKWDSITTSGINRNYC